MVTASGTAAISSALLAVLRAGDEVIATRQLYGGSYRLLRDIFPRFGIVVRYVDSDLAGIERLVNPRTKALYVETPTNPDASAGGSAKGGRVREGMGADLDHRQHVCEPRCCRSRSSMGFNLVVHSATKYLAGHSDVIAGAAAGSKALIQRVRENVIYLGGSMDPEAAFLLIRGMKTLGFRVEQQCRERHDCGASFSRSIPKSRACIIRACPRIRITSWRSGRCADSARCWRST